MTKQVILTGIRANNDLHIGNYFGALLPMVDMANSRAGEYQINMFVPDLHSFTTPIDHRSLNGQILHNVKLFVAAGLDIHNNDLYIYRQSHVPAHSELTWILDCFTGFGEMSRMTQFKDKSGLQDTKERLNEAVDEMKKFKKHVEGMKAKSGDNYSIKQFLESFDNYFKPPISYQNMIDDENSRASVGLFNYPVLMAADILLYGATYVPVGDDQTQHLEFTRDIAERLNKQFAEAIQGDLFAVPLPVAKQHEFFGKDQGLRIRDLQNPKKKMSKSDGSGRGVVFLGDEPSAAAKKIMSAETDSVGTIPSILDYDKQPGISNLLQISALLGNQPVDKVVRSWAGKTSYGDLKKDVADQVEAFLTDFQIHLSQVDNQQIQAKLDVSEKAMNKVANATLYKVQQAVGLRPL